MASVFSKRGCYYVRWKNAAGRWTRTVTACTTKRDAQRLGDDLEQKAERQAKGLEALPTDQPAMTFAELFEWWWGAYGSKQHGDTEQFLRKRLAGLWRFALPEVASARIENLLAQHSDELAPKSLNTLRGAINTIFGKAIKRARWVGLNPAVAVERRKVTRKVYETVRAEEVPALLAMLAPKWRPLFACAIWTAMRKGELLGLQKNDIDLSLGVITVRRSYRSRHHQGRAYRRDPNRAAAPSVPGRRARGLAQQVRLPRG